MCKICGQTVYTAGQQLMKHKLNAHHKCERNHLCAKSVTNAFHRHPARFDGSTDPHVERNLFLLCLFLGDKRFTQSAVCTKPSTHPRRRDDFNPFVSAKSVLKRLPQSSALPRASTASAQTGEKPFVCKIMDKGDAETKRRIDQRPTHPPRSEGPPRGLAPRLGDIGDALHTGEKPFVCN